MTNKDDADNLTRGNVRGKLLRFFFPLFLTSLLQQIYAVADAVIVGKGWATTNWRRSGTCRPCSFWSRASPGA